MFRVLPCLLTTGMALQHGVFLKYRGNWRTYQFYLNFNFLVCCFSSCSVVFAAADDDDDDNDDDDDDDDDDENYLYINCTFPVDSLIPDHICYSIWRSVSLPCRAILHRLHWWNLHVSKIRNRIWVVLQSFYDNSAEYLMDFLLIVTVFIVVCDI